MSTHCCSSCLTGAPARVCNIRGNWRYSSFQRSSLNKLYLKKKYVTYCSGNITSKEICFSRASEAQDLFSRGLLGSWVELSRTELLKRLGNRCQLSPWRQQQQGENIPQSAYWAPCCLFLFAVLLITNHSRLDSMVICRYWTCLGRFVSTRHANLKLWPCSSVCDNKRFLKTGSRFVGCSGVW